MSWFIFLHKKKYFCIIPNMKFSGINIRGVYNAD